MQQQSLLADAQVLPSIKGELADCMWPNMAACLVSSQLSSQAVRTVEMDSALTMACQKVRPRDQISRECTVHMQAACTTDCCSRKCGNARLNCYCSCKLAQLASWVQALHCMLKLSLPRINQSSFYRMFALDMFMKAGSLSRRTLCRMIRRL